MTSNSEQPNTDSFHLAEGGNEAVCVVTAAVDLQRFCASDSDLRAHLHKPWAHKGYTYATNGHICVRVPAPDQAETICPHSIADSAAAIFDRDTATLDLSTPYSEHGIRAEFSARMTVDELRELAQRLLDAAHHIQSEPAVVVNEEVTA